MTNAILEPTALGPATAESLTLVKLTAAPAQPGVEVDGVISDRLSQPSFTGSTVIQGKKLGLLGRSFHMLKSASFQVGLSLPGEVWHRESQALSDKEKAVWDAAQQGFL